MITATGNFGRENPTIIGKTTLCDGCCTAWFMYMNVNVHYKHLTHAMVIITTNVMGYMYIEKKHLFY